MGKKNVEPEKIIQIVPAGELMTAFYASRNLPVKYESFDVPLWALLSNGKVVGLELHQGRLVPVNERSQFFIGYSGSNTMSRDMKAKAEYLVKEREATPS